MAGSVLRCGLHGPDPELVYEAAVCGGHLGPRDDAAAVCAGGERQR